MQTIAAKMGHSETAFINMNPTDTSFISDTSAGGHEIRFFTPTTEIALCGHATIGSYHLLGERQLIKPGSYTMKAKAGILTIRYEEGGIVSMEQNLPKFRLTNLETSSTAAALGLTEDDICSSEMN